MINLKQLALPILVLLSAQAFNHPVWASPPNPTESDDKSNTAGGTGALLNTISYANTGFGYSVLLSNSTGDGNTATGAYALFSNTIGSNNTASGNWTLGSNITGEGNTALGNNALSHSTIGNSNTAIGKYAIINNISGNGNTATGESALSSNTSGSGNTAFGTNTLASNTSGNNNTAIGDRALINLGVGNNNLVLGADAGGFLIGGNNNIYLRNHGLADESNTIRIGRETHTRTFLAGIRGRTVANAVPVLIGANGQLGTIDSSCRFKKDNRDIRDGCHKLLELHPVNFNYKQVNEEGSNPLENGLIAKEVAKDYPDLVAYGTDGQIETVQYHKLTPMLLNELKRLNTAMDKQKDKIFAQSQEIAQLKQQMTILQTQTETINTLNAKLTRLESRQTLGMVE